MEEGRKKEEEGRKKEEGSKNKDNLFTATLCLEQSLLLLPQLLSPPTPSLLSS